MAATGVAVKSDTAEECAQKRDTEHTPERQRAHRDRDRCQRPRTTAGAGMARPEWQRASKILNAENAENR